jgi:hypothetical protein
MAMPETTIYKDTSPVFSQYQVRMPWKPLVIQPVSKTTFPQPFAHNNFWLCILVTNRRHGFVSLLWGKVVHMVTDI